MKSSSEYSAHLRASRNWAIALLACTLGVLCAVVPKSASAQTAVAPTSGDGLSTDTAYAITVLGNLVWLHDQAAANATAGKYYKLANDIDAAATATWNDNATSTNVLEGFNPIGKPSGSGWAFKGTFLGAGHMISGLFIRRTINGVGLFGGIDPGGTVINLHLVGGAVVAGDQNVGGLAGYVYRGIIQQCSNTGTVDAGGSNVGGLIGYNDLGIDRVGVSLVSQCYATGAVTGNIGSTSTDASGIGGLVGTNTGTIAESFATGNVTTGNDGAGGLVGYSNQGTITHCHATGSVSGDEYVGGLCGGSSGTISASYATGNVQGSDGEVGGLLGRNIYGAVSRCYATGTVAGSANANGGLVGYCYDGTISQSYATGSVTGSYGGGLLGGNDGVVTQCYSLGTVAGVENIGGLVGIGSAGISDSYWNTETSGLNTSAGGTGFTIAQMKQQSTFAGWDFTSTRAWRSQGAYPYLNDLTTCTLTYLAGTGGQITDGLTPGTTLLQVINLGSIGTPITPLADFRHRFMEWSDGFTTTPRTDANAMTALSVTALFWKNAARVWSQYR